jgi:hypothetical protein
MHAGTHRERKAGYAVHATAGAASALARLPDAAGSRPKRQQRDTAGAGDTTTIYVELLDENVDVWRPVAALHVRDGVYRLSDVAPEEERWAFPPGSLVRVEERELSDGRFLVACAAAE